MMYILDGYSILFRAYYAMPQLKTKTQIPIGGICGFLRALLNIIKYEKPMYLLIALDNGGRTFRDDVYENFLENKIIIQLIGANPDHFIAYNITMESVTTLTYTELQARLQINTTVVRNFCQDLNIEFTEKKIILIAISLKIDHSTLAITAYQSQYKINRKETPQELRPQFKILYEMLDAAEIQYLTMPLYEADDIIASCVTQANNNGIKTRIVSQDKDLISLISQENQMYDAFKRTIIDEEAAIAKFNIQPKQITDYLALVGDVSDNIPGVPQIGSKMAAKLLNQFNTIDTIIQNIDQIPITAKKAILNNMDLLNLSRQLAQLHTKINIDIPKLKFHINTTALETFCNKYDIKINLSSFIDISHQTIRTEQQDLFS